MGKLEKLREILLSVQQDLTLIEVPNGTLMPVVEEEMQKCNVSGRLGGVHILSSLWDSSISWVWICLCAVC